VGWGGYRGRLVGEAGGKLHGGLFFGCNARCEDTFPYTNTVSPRCDLHLNFKDKPNPQHSQNITSTMRGIRQSAMNALFGDQSTTVRNKHVCVRMYVCVRACVCVHRTYRHRCVCCTGPPPCAVLCRCPPCWRGRGCCRSACAGSDPHRSPPNTGTRTTSRTRRRALGDTHTHARAHTHTYAHRHGHTHTQFHLFLVVLSFNKREREREREMERDGDGERERERSKW